MNSIATTSRNPKAISQRITNRPDTRARWFKRCGIWLITLIFNRPNQRVQSDTLSLLFWSMMASDVSIRYWLICVFVIRVIPKAAIEPMNQLSNKRLTNHLDIVLNNLFGIGDLFSPRPVAWTRSLPTSVRSRTGWSFLSSPIHTV